MTEYLKPYNEFMILLCLIMGLVNMCLAALLLSKKMRIEKRTKEIASNLVADMKAETPIRPGMFTIRSERGFVDGGVIIALAGLAIGGLIFSREAVSKKAVVEKKPIAIGNSVYQCREVQRRVIKYFDLETQTYKILPIPPQKKECE